MTSYFISVLIVLGIFSVSALDWRTVEEGSCKEANFTIAENLNKTWLAETYFKYVVAGNKYHLYRIVSNSLNKNFPEDKFYYEGCITADVKIPLTKNGEVHAFGSPANEYTNKIIADGIVDFELVDSPTRDIARHYIVLTDNKTFVVFANCWLESDQKAWDVVSTTSTLDPTARKRIEDHMTQLGFDKNMFVFLRHDNCEGAKKIPCQ